MSTPINKNNLSEKVTKMMLKNLLNISYPTALKEYKVILSKMDIKRTYLTIQDLITYGIL